MAEKDYAKIAKKKITQPSKVKRRRNILVYSRNKKGKTFFCNTARNDGKVLFLDPEHGTDTLTKTDPDVWHCSGWEDIDPFYKFLRSGKHDYTWAAVDGLTKIHSMALNFIRKQAEERDLDRRPGQVTKRDYGDANQMIQQFIDQMIGLPVGVIFTAQERQVSSLGFDEEGDEDESIMFVPDLPAGARGFLLSSVDVIGRLYVQRVDMKKKGADPDDEDAIVKVDQRRLYLAPHTRYDTGFRSEFKLPDLIKNPTVPKLVNLMMTGE